MVIGELGDRFNKFVASCAGIGSVIPNAANGLNYVADSCPTVLLQGQF